MKDINLIERDFSITGGNYGDCKTFASYIGLRTCPRLTSGEITHGWIMREHNIDPDLVIGSNGLGYQRKSERFFVARKDQEDYLRGQGFKDVYAIGHPIIYLNNPNEHKRIPNSLLVMPLHSLPETSEDWIDSDIAYAQFIRNYIEEFSYVALCLHASDIEKNNWINLKAAIPMMFEGASLKDRNSYQRMAQLFSSFEYVTTNSFGSHVAYASYFGAKVSVCGPRAKWHRSDYASLDFYKNSPHLLDVVDDWDKNNSIVEWYPQFNCLPKEAQLNVEWAEWELGKQCRRTPAELQDLLGWTKFGQTKLISRIVMKKMKIYKALAIVYSRGYEIANFIRYFGLTRGLKNYVRIIKAKVKKSGIEKLDIFENTLLIRNGSSDSEVCIQHFGRKELLGVIYPADVKEIFDFGANIGVSVSVFRHMFPHANILAVEMDKENFRLLQENCLNDKKVSLVEGAVWNTSGEVDQIDVGHGEWALRVGNHTGTKVAKVRSYTFDELCTIYKVNQVDVLKMDIEGAEVDVLTSSWREILEKTKLLIIEVHDWIPGCTQAIARVVEEASEVFNLEVSNSGEFTLIRNLDSK